MFVKKFIFYFFLIIISLIFILFFNACPHQIIKQIEQNQALQDSIKQLKSVYLTSSVSVSNLSRFQQIQQTQKIDSLDKDSLIIVEKELSLQSDIIRINSENYPDKIELNTIIYDSFGRYITGLAPPYCPDTIDYKKFWNLIKDSCSHTDSVINEFDVTEIREINSPKYAIAFVLDHSPSMGDQRAKKLQEAIKTVMKAIKKEDFVTVIKFSKKIVLEVPITNERKTYINNILVNGIKGYGGGTAMYDGVFAGISELKKAPETHKKIVILFSDGGDNSSTIKLDSIHKLAKGNNVSIYTIGYGPSNANVLYELTQYTGGRFYQIYSSREFLYVFKDIYYSLNNYYKITYIPPKCNELHRVGLDISVKIDSTMYYTNTIGYYDKSVFSQLDPVGTVTLMNIEFDFGKADIRQESLYLIEDVAKSMNNNKSLKIKIIGHTDDIGNENDNLILSKNRAKSVYNKLIEMGVESNRLFYHGLGESKPLVPNNSEVNRQKNRRTEFIILEK